jgi:hypothetical protein
MLPLAVSAMGGNGNEESDRCVIVRIFEFYGFNWWSLSRWSNDGQR